MAGEALKEFKTPFSPQELKFMAKANHKLAEKQINKQIEIAR